MISALGAPPNAGGQGLPGRGAPFIGAGEVRLAKCDGGGRGACLRVDAGTLAATI